MMSYYTPPSGPPQGTVYPKPKRKLSAGAIVGIVLGAIALVLVCGFGGCAALLANADSQTADSRQSAGAVSDHSASTKPKHALYDPKDDVTLKGIKSSTAYGDVTRWVSFSVTNHGKIQQDYALEFGEYDASDKRIGETYALAAHVAPGETVDATVTNGAIIINENGEDNPAVKTVKLLSVTTVPDS